MARDDLHAVNTLERRLGRRDRRIKIPETWPEGRDYIETELGDLWRRSDAVADDVHAIRMILERFGVRQGMMLAIGGAVGLGMLGMFWLMAERFMSEVPAASRMTHAERIEAIVDVLPEIPATPALRLSAGHRRGFPKVSVIQDALPDVRGITALERDAACARAPDACRL